jgi:hypothetical protein
MDRSPDLPYRNRWKTWSGGDDVSSAEAVASLSNGTIHVYNRYKHYLNCLYNGKLNQRSRPTDWISLLVSHQPIIQTIQIKV